LTVGIGSAGAAVFAPSGLKDRVHAATYSRVEIAPSKRGEQFVLDNPFCNDIGERSLEPVADLDASYAIFWKNKEDNTVVVFTLTDSPSLGRSLREVLQSISGWNSWEGGDQHLIRSFPFECCEALV
jgi:hypothetical protein